MINAGKASAGEQIVHAQFKPVIAQAAEQLDMIADLDLILHEQADDVRLGADRAIARPGAEGGQRRPCTVVQGDEGARGARNDAIEEAVDALVARHLAAQFEAGEDIVLGAGKRGLPVHVGLAEQIVAAGGIDIGLHTDAAVGSQRRDGKDVGVDLVVIGPARAVTQGKAVGQAVIGSQRQRIDIHTAAIERRIAHEEIARDRRRPASLRGDAAIGRAIIRGMFIAQHQIAATAQIKAERGVHCPARQAIEITVIAGFFIKAIEAGGDAGGQRLVEIGGDAPAAPCIDRGIGGNQLGGKIGRLGDAVDDAAATTAPEDHGVGTAQDFQPIQIVEIAEILDVVAHTIDEEIGGAVVAAQHDLIAIAFALCADSTRHEAQRLLHGQNRLIVQPLFGEHGDGLRYIEQRRVGAGGGTDAAGTIRGFPLAGHHDGAGVIIQRFGLRCDGQGEQ